MKIRKKLREIINKDLIVNHFHTNYPKDALLSYIVHPFKKGIRFTHTNFAESLEIAKLLSSLGYNVDVVDFNNSYELDYQKYSLIFGFGDPLVNSFIGRRKKITTIYYGTGMHISHQNLWTLKRVKDVYQKKGVFLPESGRIVEKSWSVQTTLVDSIIALGNEVVAESYRKEFSGPVYTVPASFYRILDGFSILSKKKIADAKNTFLWFGSVGHIHKGLDLLLDYFCEQDHLELHVCGHISGEEGFESVYYEQLYKRSNIHTHGFVDITSPLFRELMESCMFVISPSCSEGGSPAVLTAMGNGGLIPVIHRFCSLDMNDYVVELDDFTGEALEKAISIALSKNEGELREMSQACYEEVTKVHSIENFYRKMGKTLSEIVL